MDSLALAESLLLQRFLCFELRNDEEFAGISSGNISDIRLGEGKIGNQLVSILRDTGLTTASLQ